MTVASDAIVTQGIRLERVPIAWNHAIEKDSLKIKEMEHVLIGKPLRTFLRTCSNASKQGPSPVNYLISVS